MNIIILSSQDREILQVIQSKGISVNAIRLKPRDDIKKIQHIERYDLAILDLDEPRWQERLSYLRNYLPVICISKPDIKKVVQAMKNGAVDYLEKPLNPGELKDVLLPFDKSAKDISLNESILGSSKVMKEVFTIVKKASLTDTNVLITGESGTGKELVAKAIHNLSNRKDKPFVTLNCSAIPDSLIESEIFGFEKGAFTGAVYSKRGIFETANNGTLFLDEIADISQLFQTKILRVLQEGEFIRLGGTSQIKIDIRLITATNKNIGELISKGMFREDLYYRLNVINIHLPPLRERKEDIPLLIKHFIKKHNQKRLDLHIKGISDQALSILLNYHFPGNVRELENIIERAISLASTSEILPSDLPQSVFKKKDETKKNLPKLKDAIVDAERETIIKALNESGWNISRASVLLGVYRQFLQKKIKTLHINH